MRDILRRYQPSRLEDLTALNALYRPGPIQGGMVDDFIERKWGRRAVQYDLPELKELLEETYGVIVYQEQVMQISNRLAGYSLGDADLLRRAMGKKKLEEMAKQRERFIKGALERGFPQKKVEKIFDLMEQFAGYGFNKSHSAAYAYLAFVTAYLKAHYPVDFMAALLTSETGNTAKVVKYINECREMGITILPPDVNHSDWSFTPDGEAIRFGLGAVKNLGQSAVEAIGKARAEVGRFTLAAPVLREGGPGQRQPAHDREPDQAPARWIRWKARAARSAPRWKAPWKPASARGAIAKAARGPVRRNPRCRRSARRAAAQRAGLDRQREAGRREGDARLLGDRPSARSLRGQDRASWPRTTARNLEGLAKNTEVALCGVLTGITRKRNAKASRGPR